MGRVLFAGVATVIMLAAEQPVVAERQDFFPLPPEAYGLQRVKIQAIARLGEGEEVAIWPHPAEASPVNLGEMLMVHDVPPGAPDRWWLEWATFDASFPFKVKVIERHPPTFARRRSVGHPETRVWKGKAGTGEPWSLEVWPAGEEMKRSPGGGPRLWGAAERYSGRDGETKRPDHPPTPARRLFEVGGEAFDYPVTLPRWGSPLPQRIREVTRNWDGTGARTIRILLPRGYDAARRSYPVCYWQDGQNMFRDSRPKDHWVESWDLGAAVERLTRAGEITDVIHVAVDNTARRLTEYLPPNARFEGKRGAADQYLKLLRDHIHPYVARNYRVIDDPQYTGMAGSSLGGLVTMYAGWHDPNFARRLGVFSASFWAAEGLVRQIQEGGPEAKKPLLVYLDSGTVGPTHDNLDGVLDVREALMRKGWLLGFDLKHVVGVGDPHNERAWRRRLDDCLRFLYPAGDVFYAEPTAAYRERVRDLPWGAEPVTEPGGEAE